MDVISVMFWWWNTIWIANLKFGAHAPDSETYSFQSVYLDLKIARICKVHPQRGHQSFLIFLIETHCPRSLDSCFNESNFSCLEGTLIKHISFIYASFWLCLCDIDKAGYSSKCKQLSLRHNVNKTKKWTNCWVRSLWVPRHSFSSKFVFQNSLCDNVTQCTYHMLEGIIQNVPTHTMRFLFGSLNMTTLIVA